MNKKVDTDSADIDQQEAVGIVPKVHPELSNKKLFVTCIACIIIIFAIAVGLLIDHLIKTSAHYKTDKVHALVKADNCSSEAQQSISSYAPNPKQLNFSIALLSYRANCLVLNLKYQQANVILEQLKSYYDMNNDPVGAANADAQIASNNAAAKIKFTPATNAKPEISPSQAQQIENFYGKSP